MSFSELRRNYMAAGLKRADLQEDPIEQAKIWLAEATSAEVPDFTAMTLATCDEQGSPSARMVLLKRLDQAGFVFFTDYSSQKGRELAGNPRAALVFYWWQLDRQLRVTGTVKKTSREESEAYFHSRPRGSQLAALSSQQSSGIATRAALEEKLKEIEGRYRDQELPLPERWGGYRVRPERIEFWQGRPNRLHDRFRYSRREDGWLIERLSP